MGGGVEGRGRKDERDEGVRKVKIEEVQPRIAAQRQEKEGSKRYG